MYGDALYNPLINPYLNNGISQNPYHQQPKQEVIKVNGEGGARAFPIGPNSSALLLDVSGELVWLVVTDGAGYKSIMPYDITPHKGAEAPDFSTLEQRIERLEEKVNANTSNIATARNESHAVESDFYTVPKPDASGKKLEGQRGSSPPDYREQPSIHEGIQRNERTGRNSERSLYE